MQMAARWTRRRLLGAGALAGTAWLAACGGDDSGSSSSTSSATQAPAAGQATGTQAAAAQRSGGTLIVQQGDLQTVDFHRHTGTMPFPSAICDCPTAIATDGSVKPMLAESFESPDAITYTFTFRRGVTFHNGREMTAEDVKANIERAAATQGAWLKGTLSSVTQQQVVGPQTLRLTLKEPYAPLLALISELWIVAPETANWGDQITNPIGTGPFVFKQWVPKEAVTTTRHEGYWQSPRPLVEALTVKFIESDASIALRAGDVHIAGIGRDQIDLLSKEKEIGVQYEKATSWNFLSFNNRHPRPPYDDIRVRRAIAYALDKETITEVQAGPSGQVANQMAPAGSFYHDAGLADPFAKPDLAQARRLLQEAGIAPGTLKPVMPVNTNPQTPQVVAQQLAQIGVQPDLQVADDVATETRLQKYDWDIFYAGSGPRSDIALRFVRMMSDGANPGLWGGVQDPDYDRAVRRAFGTVEDQARKAAYLDAWKIVMDKLYTIVVNHTASAVGVRNQVQGFETGAVANLHRIDGGVTFVSLQR
jgi:peptide/nickel transport system substrate-binding protein